MELSFSSLCRAGFCRIAFFHFRIRGNRRRSDESERMAPQGSCILQRYLSTQRSSSASSTTLAEIDTMVLAGIHLGSGRLSQHTLVQAVQTSLQQMSGYRVCDRGARRVRGYLWQERRPKSQGECTFGDGRHGRHVGCLWSTIDDQEPWSIGSCSGSPAQSLQYSRRHSGGCCRRGGLVATASATTPGPAPAPSATSACSASATSTCYRNKPCVSSGKWPVHTSGDQHDAV